MHHLSPNGVVVLVYWSSSDLRTQLPTSDSRACESTGRSPGSALVTEGSCAGWCPCPLVSAVGACASSSPTDSSDWIVDRLNWKQENWIKYNAKYF